MEKFQKHQEILERPISHLEVILIVSNPLGDILQMLSKGMSASFVFVGERLKGDIYNDQRICSELLLKDKRKI